VFKCANEGRKIISNNNLLFVNYIFLIDSVRTILLVNLSDNFHCSFETKDKGTNTFSLLSEMWKPTQDKETKISPERIWNINFSNMETIRKANSAEIKHLRKRVQSDKSGEKTRKLTL